MPTKKKTSDNPHRMTPEKADAIDAGTLDINPYVVVEYNQKSEYQMGKEGEKPLMRKAEGNVFDLAGEFIIRGLIQFAIDFLQKLLDYYEKKLNEDEKRVTLLKNAIQRKKSG